MKIRNSVITQQMSTWFPLSWLRKNPRPSRPPEAFFQDPAVSQNCLNIATNSSYGSGEHCKLPSEVRKYFWHSASQKTYLVATIVVINSRLSSRRGNPVFTFPPHWLTNDLLRTKYEDSPEKKTIRFDSASNSIRFSTANQLTFLWIRWMTGLICIANNCNCMPQS